MRPSSSDDAMNGGTVSMWVEKKISGTIMPRPCGHHVRARAFDGHFLSVKFSTLQFVEEKIAYRGLIRSYRFDIDETAGEVKKVIHAAKA